MNKTKLKFLESMIERNYTTPWEGEVKYEHDRAQEKWNQLKN